LLGYGGNKRSRKGVKEKEVEGTERKKKRP
jgi:hypothetical protein